MELSREALDTMNETDQRTAAILRAILTTELDRWEIERRHTLQHPQATQYQLIAGKKLTVGGLECDWFYIYASDPPIDHLEYYPLELGAAYRSLIPRNVKRYGPIRGGLVFLPQTFNVKFWLVWGVGTKDSNLSFEQRPADENPAPQDHQEHLVAGPTPFFGKDNARLQVAVYVPAGAGNAQLTDIGGAASGAIFPAGTLTWVDGKAASDLMILKPTAVPVLVNATGYMIERRFPLE